MAGFLQNLFATFDPTVAVNKEGDLVNANGFFDTGNDSTDYVDPGDLSAFQDILYTNFENPGAGFHSSDSLADLNNIDAFYNALKEQNESFNNQAMASADRAMEFNAEQAEINRRFQQAANQKSMDFSERMANTAYQRGMADLKAAGLNPKLIGQLGAASSPSGVSSSGSSASGSAAQLSAMNLAPLASVLNSYITSSDSLSRRNNDFVQNIISGVFSFAAKAYMSGG